MSDQQHNSGRCRFMPFVAGIILSCLCLGWPGNARAQFPSFLHYSAGNGLPSTEVLDLCQDGDGYLWFATAYGVSRFDGREFREFTTAGGLPALATTTCFLSPGGQAWFASYEARLSFALHGKIVPYRFNGVLSAALMHSPLVNLVWLSDGSIVAKTGKTPLPVLITAGGQVGVYCPDVFDQHPSADLWVCPEGKALIWSVNPGDRTGGPRPEATASSDGRQSPAGYFFSFRDDLLSELPAGRADYMIKLPYCYVNPGEWYIGFGERVFRLKEGKLKLLRTLEGTVTDIFLDRPGQCWISQAGHGVSLFRDGMPDGQQEIFLDHFSVSSLCQDHQGGTWFATLENGVYQVPAFDFATFTGLHPGLGLAVATLCGSGRRIVVSTHEPAVYVLTSQYGSSPGKEDLKVTPFREPVTAMTAARDGSLWLAGTRDLHFDDRLRPISLNGRHSAYAYQVLNEGDTTWVVTDQGVHLYTGREYKGLRWGFHTGAHPRTLGTDSSGRRWIGAFNGLYLAGDSLEYLGRLHPFFRERITCLAFTNSQMWVGSRTAGLLLRQGDRLQTLTTADGLLSDCINALLPDEGDVLWVGTNKGLNRITPDYRRPGHFIIRSFTTWEGLPDGEILQIAKASGSIWLGTNKGPVQFDPARIERVRIVPPRMNIDKIVLNDTLVLSTLPSEFAPGENTLSFYYTGISFKHHDRLVYRYKLHQADTHWILTPNPSVRLAGLGPGSYTFTIQAAIPGSAWSEPALNVPFTIRKPFTETLTFILTAAAGILLLFTAALLLVLRGQQRKAALKNAILLSEIKALRSQMNPHFIFNSLNSIQYFILEKKEADANHYLSEFARLIRRILEQSRRNLITMEEELDTIRLYIELEKMRFSTVFTYAEQISPGLDLSAIRIPPMLLQPFLENSIWHGLAPRQTAGELILNLSETINRQLKISITDNGIGRAAAGNATRHPGHLPVGMRNVEERVALFNQVNRSDLFIRITDLYGEQGEAAGTTVEIILPEQLIA